MARTTSNIEGLEVVAILADSDGSRYEKAAG